MARSEKNIEAMTNLLHELGLIGVLDLILYLRDTKTNDLVVEGVKLALIDRYARATRYLQDFTDTLEQAADEGEVLPELEYQPKETP